MDFYKYFRELQTNQSVKKVSEKHFLKSLELVKGEEKQKCSGMPDRNTYTPIYGIYIYT